MKTLKVGDYCYINDLKKVGVVEEIKDDKVTKVAIKTPHGVEIINTIGLVVRIIQITDFALQVLLPIFKKWWRIITKRNK